MRKGRSGVILIGVMGILALLCLVIADLLFNVAKQMRYESLFADKEDLRQTAYNRLALVMGVLQEIHIVDNGLKSAEFQGWDAEGLDELLEDFELPEDTTCKVETWDETGKIPLHAVDEVMLNELFSSMELSKEAGMLSDSLLDFLEKDAEGSRQFGARDSFYQRQNPAYFPKEADFLSFDELQLVQGFDKAFFDPEDKSALARLDFLKTSCSLYHKGLVNVNTSNHNVRYVLSKADPEFVAEAIEQRLTREVSPELTQEGKLEEPKHKEFFKQKDPLLGKLLGVCTRIVGIRIDAQRYEHHFRIEAIVAVPVKDDASAKTPKKSKSLANVGKPPIVIEDPDEAEKKARLSDAAARVKYPEIIALREF